MITLFAGYFAFSALGKAFVCGIGIYDSKFNESAAITKIVKLALIIAVANVVLYLGVGYWLWTNLVLGTNIMLALVAVLEAVIGGGIYIKYYESQNPVSYTHLTLPTSDLV
eukprot:TRINITY_DN14203_c0_g1_i2.p1 TRINITY_DN14203_c0_g1~~TRINITY_DN14203_c0_g1_i2.p1  ORF type:complete len:111 (+),score=11.13 TRINITY_DN14203_c0_g1_i2:328-660(+)